MEAIVTLVCAAVLYVGWLWLCVLDRRNGERFERLSKCPKFWSK